MEPNSKYISFLSGQKEETIFTNHHLYCIGKVKKSIQTHCLQTPNKERVLNSLNSKLSSVATKDILQTDTVLSLLPKPKSFSIRMAHNHGDDEEELIQKLVEQAKLREERECVIPVPHHAVVARNWRRCILAKVITNWKVSEENFSISMRAAWRVHPNTVIEEKKEGTFLVEFVTEKDLLKVLDGWWNYRGEMIAMTRIYSMQEANEAQVNTIDMWVQAHGFPVGLIKPNAIPNLLRVIGTPISDPQVIHKCGLKAYKIKFTMSLHKPVLDTVSLDNETIGKYKVYLVYDKVKKICLFCGMIGHVKEQCADRRMMLRMRESDKQKNNAVLWSLPDINFKPWIIDETKVPMVGSSMESILDPIDTGAKDAQTEIDRCKGKKIMEDAWDRNTQENMQLTILNQHIFTAKGGVKRGAGDILAAGSDAASEMQADHTIDDDEETQPLNRKRAREANPNSPPSSQ